MMKLRIIGAAAAALVLLFPLSATATAAPDDTAARAAGKNWDTVGNVEGALHQACRVSVDNGAKWRVYNRLDARQGEVRADAEMTVLHNGVATGAVWRSGWVTPGNVSDVGSVLVPRKPGYKVKAFQGDDAGGGSSVFKVASLNHC